MILADVPGMSRVRVEDFRPGDVLVGSSRTVVTLPAPASRRRHVELVVEDSEGNRRLVVWKANTLVYVRRPVETPAPRRDIDG